MAKVDAYCQELQVMFHTDASQEIVEVPVDLIVALVESDMMMIVGHKFGAPKGIFALYF